MTSSGLHNWMWLGVAGPDIWHRLSCWGTKLCLAPVLAISSCLIQENVSCFSAFDGIEHGVTMHGPCFYYSDHHAGFCTAECQSRSLWLSSSISNTSRIHLFTSSACLLPIFWSMFFLEKAFFCLQPCVTGRLDMWVAKWLAFLHFLGCRVAGLPWESFSFDRAMWIFRPFCYSRWSKNVSKILVTVPWFLIIIHVPLQANFEGRINRLCWPFPYLPD